MKIAKSLALGLSCALAAAGSAQAQGQPKQFVQVLTVHAKPEGAVDYEAFVKKVMAAGEKIGQNQRVVTYQVTTGGPGYTYMIATYFDKWAETDGLLSVARDPEQGAGRSGGRQGAARRARQHRVHRERRVSPAARLSAPSPRRTIRLRPTFSSSAPR